MRQPPYGGCGSALVVRCGERRLIRLADRAGNWHRHFIACGQFLVRGSNRRDDPSIRANYESEQANTERARYSVIRAPEGSERCSVKHTENRLARLLPGSRPSQTE